MSRHIDVDTKNTIPADLVNSYSFYQKGDVVEVRKNDERPPSTPTSLVVTGEPSIVGAHHNRGKFWL
jgi:hypothetical protein